MVIIGGNIMKEIKKFIGLTFLISWISWGLLVFFSQLNILDYGTPIFMIIYVLGGIAPALCGVFIKKHNSNKEEYKAYLKNIINPKHHILWYVFIVISILINYIVKTMVTNGIGSVILIKPFYIAIISLPIMIVGGGLEEIGWRGFLQPRLEERFTPLLSTLSVGVIWSLWHLPLWFIVGTNQTNMNYFSFFISALSLSFLFAVVYEGTNSIFMCILIHAFFNSCLEIFGWNNNLIANVTVLLINVLIFIVYQHHINKDMKKSPSM